MAFRPETPQLEFFFGPTAPPVALRRAGEEFRALGVLYRPVRDAGGAPVAATPDAITATWESVVGSRGFDQRLTNTPLIVIDHELWVRTGEPYYVAKPSHTLRLVTAYSDVWRSPYARELEGVYFADEHEVMLAHLADWEARGYKVTRGDELPATETTAEFKPGSTVLREALRDMPDPDAIADDQFAGAAQEVASRLRLANAVPRGSKAPLLDYDAALLDPSQRRIADDWVAAVLVRGLELERFDGIDWR